MKKIIGIGILVSMLFVTAVSAEAATLRVINNTGYTIYYLYVSPAGSSGWGEDMLGSNVLSSGNDFRVNVQDGASYDVRLVDEDGDSYTRMNMRPSGGSGNWYLEFTMSHID